MSHPNSKTTFKVSATRHRDSESIYVNITVGKGVTGSTAHFYLNRAEAYDLAEKLQTEADWLAELSPPVELKSA